jgi:cell division protein FtsN
MANETPKKPIRRNTVPAVSKEAQKLPKVEQENNTVQNVVLFVLFLLVSSIVYVAIFQQPLISKYLGVKNTAPSAPIIADTTSIEPLNDSTETEEDVLNTFIGEEKSSPKSNQYAVGNNYYLVAGTFIFYPYAEKCRDRLKAQGYEADIISTGENHTFHRVYIQTSTDGAAIRAKRDELHQAGNTEVWVYAE